MNDVDKALNTAATVKNNAQSKLLEFARSYIVYVILAINISLSVILRLYDVGLKNPFTVSFFASFAVNVSSTMLVYICYVYHGAELTKKTSPAYSATAKAWSELSAKIRATYINAFSGYIRKYSTEVVESKRRAILESRSLIPWAVFCEKYRATSAKEIKAEYKASNLSKRDYRAILAANKPIRPPVINAVNILCGAEAINVEHIESEKISFAARQILARPAGVFVASAILSSITASGTAEEITALAIILPIFQLVVAAVMGVFSGASATSRELGAIKSKVYFQNLFFADLGKPIDKPADKE